MTKINWKEQMAELHASLPERLENIAKVAETSNRWTDTERLMPATGVADILYEALDKIKYHRKLAGLKKRADAAWRAWQSEESRDRGYDRDKVARLRDEYYALQEELEKTQ